MPIRTGPASRRKGLLTTQRLPGTVLANRWGGHDEGMVLEHAVLDVIPGKERSFEEAFEEARGIISASSGFVSLRLERCIERPCRYLLLVGWERLQDHTEGFRGSPAYDEWKRLLHHFYEPFPTVEHFETVSETGR